MEPTTQPDTARSATAAERLFWIFLIAGHLYYFHRWVLGYSDSTTSPTYVNTPVSWQAGKYLIVAVLTGLCILAILVRRPAAQSTHGFAAGLAALTVLSYAVTLVTATAGVVAVAENAKVWFFLPLVLLMPFFYRGERSARMLYRVGAVLVVYHVVFSIIEIGAYYTVDRLPALAYEGGLVRFGGGLDDPNGFGMWLILPILVLLAGWPAKGRWGLPTIVVLMVLLGYALSYSALVAFVVGTTSFILIGREYRKGLGLLAVLAPAAIWVVTSDYFAPVLADKSTSAASRILTTTDVTGKEPLTYFRTGASVSDLLFGAPQMGVRTEVSYLTILANQGVIVLALTIALMIATIGRGMSRTGALRRAGGSASARLFAALTAFEIAFTVTCLGVPHLGVFPVNVAFWVVAMVIWLPFDSTVDQDGNDSLTAAPAYWPAPSAARTATGVPD